MIAIPLIVVAASIGAAVYMAFVWHPALPTRVQNDQL
jgi:hypothetical protein